MSEGMRRFPLRIVVIGGGIAGLAAAHRFQEIARERSQPLEVLLIEGSARPGGVVGTERREGFLLERGPDSFLTEKPYALDLCRRLGLAERLIGVRPSHGRSFLVRSGRLLPIPDGFQLLAPSRLRPFLGSPIFSWPGKLRMAMDWVLPPRRDDGDESLAAFVERRLGREALERMAQPLIAGIYGADPQSLSLRATMPRFFEMERAHGSVIRAIMAQRRARRVGGSGQATDRNTRGARRSAAGVSGTRYARLASLSEGMQALVDALVERLPEGALRLSTRVRELRPQQDGTWRIGVAGSSALRTVEQIEADAVCLALPACQAAALVEPFDAALADRLAAIPYVSSSTISLAYRRAEVPHPLDGSGFVVPATERRALLSCTFSSSKFAGRAPEGHVLLRGFLGASEIGAGDDATLLAAVRSDLRDLLGITAAPGFAVITRHRQARPQYTVGHLDRIAAIEAGIGRYPGLAVAGSAYRGAGVPDCVRSGEEAAERLLAVEAVEGVHNRSVAAENRKRESRWHAVET
jgi:oxygen-dependent protoporphyrinogen oxidase